MKIHFDHYCKNFTSQLYYAKTGTLEKMFKSNQVRVKIFNRDIKEHNY